MENSALTFVYIGALIIATVIGKYVTNWYHEIKKRNQLLEAQVKLLAQIAAANNVSKETISIIAAEAGITRISGIVEY